jgi:hypothetical protein
LCIYLTIYLYNLSFNYMLYYNCSNSNCIVKVLFVKACLGISFLREAYISKA